MYKIWSRGSLQMCRLTHRNTVQLGMWIWISPTPPLQNQGKGPFVWGDSACSSEYNVSQIILMRNASSYWILKLTVYTDLGKQTSKSVKKRQQVRPVPWLQLPKSLKIITMNYKFQNHDQQSNVLFHSTFIFLWHMEAATKLPLSVLVLLLGHCTPAPIAYTAPANKGFHDSKITCNSNRFVRFISSRIIYGNGNQLQISGYKYFDLRTACSASVCWCMGKELAASFSALKICSKSSSRVFSNMYEI